MAFGISRAFGGCHLSSEWVILHLAFNIWPAFCIHLRLDIHTSLLGRFLSVRLLLLRVYKNYLVYKYAFVYKNYLVYKYALVYKFSVSSSPFRYKKRFRCSVARRLWG